jgi:hypothetical protein
LATKTDIENLRQSTKADIESLRLATKADIETSNLATKAEIIKWMFGIGFAQVAMIVTILKLHL